MKSTVQTSLYRSALVLVLTLFLTGAVAAQSTSQEYPSPVVSSEITGSIRARDIGDARTTSFFYTLNAGQGDLFINISTRNLNGNVDVFAADGLRLLTRVTVFADAAESETGRVVYFRKPERLILRVEGRTPNDDPATFRIKFAGSFQPLIAGEAGPEPALPEVRTENESGIRVNSVGTIIEVRPRSTPVTESKSSARSGTSQTADDANEKNGETKVKSADGQTRVQDEDRSATPVDRSAAETAPTRPARRSARSRSARANDAPTPAPQTSARARTDGDRPTNTGEAPRPSRRAPEPSPLAGVNLVVVFKDGRRIERPMTDVVRFTVDHGNLTILSKDGKTNRFPIGEVAKVSVE